MPLTPFNRPQGTIYVISDGTGETAATMIRAALIHFHDRDINIIRLKNLRAFSQINQLIQEVQQNQGLIVHTVISDDLRESINELALNHNIPVIDLLGPIMKTLEQYFGEQTTKEGEKAGVLRAVDDRYFKRIEAIEFTVRHDDGKLVEDLEQADIVLIGLSRTSKTPLSIFLSHKGWKVANIPLVINTPLPEKLFTIDQRKIVGLIIDSESLLRIRRKRLEKFGQDPASEYASMKYIQQEMDFAQKLFKKNRKWPLFDVTDRALEETAAEILRIFALRLNLPYDQIL